jgi:uncharacterized protein
MRTRTSLALIFSLIVCTALTSAADISAYPKKMTAYVNDFANIIDDAAEKSLNETLKAYDTSTTNEFIVATFPELKGNLEETTLELFRAWGIGKTDKNNGLVFFVFVKDENGKGKTRIEVGKGLEGVLPDSKTKLIYEHDVRPFLVKHDFTGGIQACMTKLMQASVHEYTAATANTVASAPTEGGVIGFVAFFLVALVIIAVVLLFMFGSSSTTESQQKAAYKYERAASKPYTPAPKPTSTASHGADRYSSSSPPSSYSTGAKVGAGVVGGVVAGGVAASLLSRKKPTAAYPSYSGSGSSSTRSPVASSSGVALGAAAAATAAAAASAAAIAATAKRRKEEEEAEEEEERRRRRRRDEDSSASSGWGGSSDSSSSSSWGSSSDSSSSSSFDSGGGSCDGGGSSGDF